jgi:glucose/arabinose dehydrogenase
MRKGITVASVILFSFLLLILGCQSAPQKELAAAKDALQKAQEAEADKYAPDLFTQAKDSIAEAENLIAMKKYGEAKQLLISAKGVAESAIQQAGVNKEETKSNVEDFMAAIDNGMRQLHETQDKAKQWKIPETVWKLTDEMARWDEQLKRAKAEYDAGNYYLARILSAQIHQELTAKDNQLREMILAKEGKK